MCSVCAGGLQRLTQLTQMQNEMVGQLPPTHKHTWLFLNEENTGYAYVPIHFSSGQGIKPFQPCLKTFW